MILQLPRDNVSLWTQDADQFAQTATSSHFFFIRRFPFVKISAPVKFHHREMPMGGSFQCVIAVMEFRENFLLECLPEVLTVSESLIERGGFMM
jgi:hypothetical protein